MRSTIPVACAISTRASAEISRDFFIAGTNRHPRWVGIGIHRVSEDPSGLFVAAEFHEDGRGLRSRVVVKRVTVQRCAFGGKGSGKTVQRNVARGDRAQRLNVSLRLYAKGCSGHRLRSRYVVEVACFTKALLILAGEHAARDVIRGVLPYSTFVKSDQAIALFIIGRNRASGIAVACARCEQTTAMPPRGAKAAAHATAAAGTFIVRWAPGYRETSSYSIYRT